MEVRDRQRFLTTYTAPQRARKPVIAVDIETDGLGGPFLLGAYAREGETEVTFFASVAEWMEAIFAPRNRGYTWYAHNGGEYDYKYLVGALRAEMETRAGLTCRVIAQGGDRVIGFVLTQPKGESPHSGTRRWELRDSYALIPCSLRQLTETLAPEHIKQDFDHAHTRFCPGLSAHREYLSTDVLGLLAALGRFFALVEQSFGVGCAWTIAATALRAWRATIPAGEGYWRLNPAAEAFCREGYYGGLVFFTTRQRQPNCTALDVNSMYPAVMRRAGVPLGGCTYTTERRQGAAFYRVSVLAPSSVPRPCIGYRQGHATLWPTGHFTTVTTSAEMEYAETLGYRFQVIEGWVFRTIAHPFDRFVNRCEQLRAAYRGTGVEFAVKLLQNGLYGKFGSRPEIERFELREEDPAEWGTTSPAIDERTGEELGGVYVTLEELRAPYLHVEWAAWITAQARLTLLEAISAVGDSEVLYGDTDSLTARTDAVEAAVASGRVSIGTGYGQLKREHVYRWFHTGGPKNYQGLLEDGQIVDRLAGLSRSRLDAQDHAEALDGAEVRVRVTRMNRTLQVLMKGKAFQEQGFRSYAQFGRHAGWVVGDDGSVRPVHLAEETVQLVHIEEG